MRATILIVTRNRAPQLTIALESIRARAYEDTEIIVVDDGSTDSTPTILAGYTDILTSLRISRQGAYRTNPSAVFNNGHAVAKNEIVIEQGGEVCHLTDCVTPLVEICRPGVVALARVHHGTPDEYHRLQGDIAADRYPYWPANYTPEQLRTNGDTWVVPRMIQNNVRIYCGLERPAPFLFCGAIHQQDFDAVGGYDASLPNRNDEDLANRLIARGVKFTFVGNAVAFHLEHPKT